jgi:hypothetical protein
MKQKKWMLIVGLFVLLGLSGCGGGGGGITTPQVEPFDPTAYQQMTIVSNEAANKYATLLEQGTPAEAAAQETVSWAKTQPNITYAASSSDGTAVWLEFDTGVVRVITQLPGAVPDTSPPLQLLSKAITRDAGTIAGNNKALNLNADWPFFPPEDNQDFYEMLKVRGYTPEELKGDQVNVMAFRNLTQYSIVHIDTHGPALEDVPKIGPVFITREQITEQKDNSLYADDLRNKYLVHATIVTPESRGRVIPYHGYYAVTAKDIARMPGTFPKYSFVLADACCSLADPRMAQAFKQKGLWAYAGWDDVVRTGGSSKTVRLLLDLLTAANHYTLKDSYPTSDGKRLPMNLGNALSAVKQEGYGTKATVHANLLLAYGDSFEFQFAPMPHLDSLLFNDRAFNQRGVRLSGSFGTTLGSFQLDNLGLIPLSPENWSESSIFIPYRLVPEGAPVVGEVRIVVNGLKSNPLAYYVPSIYSGHGTNGSYWVEIFVKDPAHQATRVIASGPAASGGISLTWYPSWREWFVNIPLPNPPPANPIYQIRVDGAPQAKFSAQVLGYFNAFPQALFPADGSTIDQLSYFTWKPSPVSGARHGLHLYGPNGEIWANENVTGTSIRYTGPSLAPNTSYLWMIHASDPDTGNLAADYASFIYRPAKGQNGRDSVPPPNFKHMMPVK